QWGAELEQQQEKLVKDAFTNHYQQRPGSTRLGTVETLASTSGGGSTKQVSSSVIKVFDCDDLFGPRARSRAVAVTDELDAYASFHVPGTYNHHEPLRFWRDYEKMWPAVAQMARDYLAIPTTSTPAERIFSRSRALLPYQRNRMSNDRIRELMLADAWYLFSEQVKL
ncbi:hypothetical protein DFQ27_004043, partial [Actinomortierella ambigua]